MVITVLFFFLKKNILFQDKSFFKNFKIKVHIFFFHSEINCSFLGKKMYLKICVHIFVVSIIMDNS